MPDFWGNETSYDKNKNQRDTEKAAEDAADYSTNIKPLYDSYMTNPSGSFSITGDNNTQREVASNLSQVGAMTGQTIFDAGKQQQDYYSSLQNRRGGGDAVADAMRNQRNRNVANVSRSFQGKGVAGGVAAAGMNSAENEADSSINSQKQAFGRQNDNDLWNYVKRNQKVTGEALSSGEDKGLAQGMDISQAQGAFGTVICTELYLQGIMGEVLYAQDVAFGRKVEAEFPSTMAGYRFLAAPVVFGMRKSKLITKLVTPFAMSWARSMVGEPEILGSMVLFFGAPICGFVGLFLPKEKVAHV